MDEQEPRIVARGEWIQDEQGDITYTPTGCRPVFAGDEDDAPAETDDWPAHLTANTGGGAGYRMGSEDVWDRARQDYLAGETAQSVCDRHGLRPGTLKSRAQREGWRRGDQPDPEPVDLDAEIEDGLPDYARMAAHALVRADRAMLRGRAAEAGSWLRLHQRLIALTPPPEKPAPEKPAPAPPPARPSRPPDPYAAINIRSRALEGLARDIAALAPKDIAGRAALERRLADLGTPEFAGPISDHSDLSDPVSLSPESEFDTEPPPDSS